MARTIKPPAERFWESVGQDGPFSLFKNAPGPCWTWNGGHNRDGYAQITANGRTNGAHRFSYELHIGPIPVGLEVDHCCRRRDCTNPDHLRAVTHAENMRNSNVGHNSRSKTHCPQGHAYDRETVGPYGKQRVCGTCARKATRAYRERLAAAEGRVIVPYATRTHCPQGHEYTEANTYMYRGSRSCRECHRERARLRMREVRARKRAERSETTVKAA